ncbi:MAG: TonB-dependent receptor [Candidatus Delongbacteria bacterium]|nr:TonB-dependent receptor [Candidatus Delongbacteria bacterium]MDD4204488.1 TonB-dependent receptor [Candidatus Delongbacteria bacterium]
MKKMITENILKALFVILLLVFNIAYSQTFKITGKIVESTGEEPLPEANVILHKKSGSVLKGAVTDSLGVFKIKLIPSGNYFIEIKYMGFIPDTISHLDISANINLGDIFLKPSEILLDEIVVKGKADIYTSHLDKKVYNVSKDILSESSSTSEILQNIPSVNVDINGGITLRNTSNITFFVNGKPSALLRNNPSAVSDLIPASSIEKIEIITNPSAKYKPDGVGGIINIVLKKNMSEGLNGQISANVGNDERYNANINLNYGTKKLKLYGNYGLRHSKPITLFTDAMVYKDSLGIANSFFSEDGKSKIDIFGHNIIAGANYKFDDYNNIEISGTYDLQNSFHDGNSDIISLDSLQNPNYNITNVQTDDELEEEGEVSLTYEHVFNKNEDHTLTFEAIYSAYNEKEDKIYNQNQIFPITNTDISRYIIEKNGNQQELNLEYTLPINENSEIESGYSGEFIFDNIWYNKNSVLSKFLFNRQVHAFYGLFGQSVEIFSYKAGLRAEETNTKSHLITPIDTLITNNYFKLFPTIHLGYDITDDNKLSMSYSKRVNRPDPDELNPNPEYNDLRNAEMGNPNLKPEQIHSIEFGYEHIQKKFSINTTLYYRYKYDAFTGISTNIGDTLVMFTTTNLTTQKSGGFEAVISGDYFKDCSYSLTGDIYFSTIDASNLGYSDNKSSISGNIKGYTLIKLTKSTSFQINGYYYFPKITPQGQMEDFYYFNLGLKQNLFNNKASITLTGTDVFHTYKVNYSINSDELNQKSNMQRMNPVISLGFIWRFNNYQEEDKIIFDGNGIKK